MQSEAQMMLGISRSTESGAAAGSRTEKKESSVGASAFLELFSGSLAQSYENDALSTKSTSGTRHLEAAIQQRETNRVEQESRNERFDEKRAERNERRNESRVQREDSSERSRVDNSRSRTESSERSADQARSEKNSETKRSETAKSEPRDKVEKNNTAETQVNDSKRAAKSNAQARALANLMSGANKAEASEVSTKQVEQLVKSAAKVNDQAQTAKVQDGVSQAKAASPEAAAVAKNAATAKVAENSARAAEAQTDRPNAVQAAEAPKHGANAQTGGEQQQSSAGNNLPSGVNAATGNQEAARLAAQHNRGFAAAMKEAAQSNAVGKAGAAGAASSQVALNNAASQYSKAATHVFNAPKAQAATQAQPSQVISQLIRAAKISMQNGREEMKILLKPEELGWLKVKITVEGNRVTAHFGAQNEFVRGLLESNISQLQQALQNNNLKVNQIQIDVANQQLGQQHSGAAGDTSNNGRNGSMYGSGFDDDSDIEESMAEELYFVPDTAALELSAVDLRI